MGFWYYVIVLVVTLALSYLLQKRPDSPKAATLGDFQAPTAEEGRAIPVAFGTVQLEAPNVVDDFDLFVKPITSKPSSLSKKITIGYRYMLGMQMALCHGPIDNVTHISVGGKTVSPYSIVTFSGGKNWQISLEDLFGGDKQEGGLAGNATIYFGSQTQTKNPYLVAQRGADTSAYPGLAYVVLEGGSTLGEGVPPATPYGFHSFYLGTSPYLKNWAFTVQRFPTIPGLTAGHNRIGDDANASCIVYEAITNTRWGLKANPARVDTAAFLAFAELCYSEGFGMSFTIDRSQPADQIFNSIQQTMDCVIYTDPSTGLWTIKPIRADYDPNTLTTFTAADLAGAPEMNRPSWTETVNQVKVTYLDRDGGWVQKQAVAMDGGNYAVQGQAAAVTISPVGVTTAANANRVANRSLRALSYPLASLTLKLNRKAWNLRPGQPFKLTWQPPEGPGWTGMVLRAGTIRYGKPTDGWITVEAKEDVFGTTWTVWDGPPASDWTPGTSSPLAPAVQRLIEAPYQLVGTGRYVYALASRADSTSFDAEIWTEKSGTYVHSGDMGALTPSGLLSADFSYRRAAEDAVGFTITVATGRDIAGLVAQSTDAGGLYRGDNIAVIDNEMVSWQTCTNNGDGTYTFAPVLRGIADTVPVTHTSGTRVWFASEGLGATDGVPYTADLTVKAKILPRNPLGTLPISSGVESTLATVSRSLSPNPPGKAKVKTHLYADWPATITDDADYTWKHRDRVAIGIASPLISQDDNGPYTPEGTLTLEVLVGGSVIGARTIIGTTAEALSYTAAQRGADDTDGTKGVSLRITPKNGSQTGTIRTTPEFIMTGAGMCAGMYAGGIEA